MYFTEGHTNLAREAIGPFLPRVAIGFGSDGCSRWFRTRFFRFLLPLVIFQGGPEPLPLLDPSMSH